MKKESRFFAWMMVLGLISLACQVFTPGTEPSFKETEIALSVQQTSLALQQANHDQQTQQDVEAQPTYTLYPTYTEHAPSLPTQEPPTLQAPPQNTATLTLEPTQDVLFQRVMTDRIVFYCVPSSGPTTLEITVEMSDVNRGATLFWRLEEKGSNKTTDWEFVDMQRAGGNVRTYTFDANSWAGTNNFYYPPLMGESWFEYQIISNDGKDRTEVFVNVTFFPCAQ